MQTIVCIVLITFFSSQMYWLYNYLQDNNQNKNPVFIKQHKTYEYELWEMWKQKMQMSDNTHQLESYRFSTFINNLKFIPQYSERMPPKDFLQYLTPFMHLSRDEFKYLFLNPRSSLKNSGGSLFDQANSKKKNKSSLDDLTNILSLQNQLFKQAAKSAQYKINIENTVDWRNTPHVVSPIKDQLNCNSDWAFAAVEAIESQLAMQYNKSINLSKQQVIDCSDSFGNYGCENGTVINAYEYIQKNSLMQEAEYPYTGEITPTCKARDGGIGIGGYEKITKGDCQSLADALKKHPVVVHLDVTNFLLYQGGVFDNCEENLNHYALAVGITNDYFIIKNSWTESWGENGYIRLRMGNTCGICNDAVYPIMRE